MLTSNEHVGKSKVAFAAMREAITLLEDAGYKHTSDNLQEQLNILSCFFDEARMMKDIRLGEEALREMKAIRFEEGMNDSYE